jgi:small nuclear ribonucleoprotein E
MNLVIDDAVEVKLQSKEAEESRRDLGTTCINLGTSAKNALSDESPGQILLKGDNVALIQSMS